MILPNKDNGTIQLPPINTIALRNGNDRYGACWAAAEYCGVSEPVPPVPGSWSHTWVPRYIGEDKTLVEGYLHLQRFNMSLSPEFTIGKREADIMHEFGWDAYPIGMPIIYLPEIQVPRKPGSLLVMPLHYGIVSLMARPEDGRHFKSQNQDYVEVINRLRPHFSQIVICVHPEDVRAGLYINDFQAAGFEVIIGSEYTDVNGLKKMSTLLPRFEFMTTNGFGTHIAYAAYFGTKVSIYGQYVEINYQDYLKYPDNRSYWLDLNYQKKYLDAVSGPTLRRHFPFLFCHPLEAKELTDWGRKQVGYDNKVTPERMRNLFHWTPFQLLAWRYGGQHLATIKGAVKQILPDRVRHLLKMVSSSQYRYRQSCLSNNVKDIT